MKVRDLHCETELALPALMKRKLKDDPGLPTLLERGVTKVELNFLDGARQ